MQGKVQAKIRKEKRYKSMRSSWRTRLLCWSKYRSCKGREENIKKLKTIPETLKKQQVSENRRNMAWAEPGVGGNPGILDKPGIFWEMWSSWDLRITESSGRLILSEFTENTEGLSLADTSEEWWETVKRTSERSKREGKGCQWSKR